MGFLKKKTKCSERAGASQKKKIKQGREKKRNRGRMQIKEKKEERERGRRVEKRGVVGAERRQPENHIWK